ncbi:hypothetical protein LXL04_010325 [Taraxacum kok-saghyz]
MMHHRRTTAGPPQFRIRTICFRIVGGVGGGCRFLLLFLLDLLPLLGFFFEVLLGMMTSPPLHLSQEKFDQAQPQSELQNEVNNVELNNDQMELEQPVDHEKAQSDGNNDASVSLDLDDHEPSSVELNNDQEKSDQAQPAELLNEENTGGLKSDQMPTSRWGRRRSRRRGFFGETTGPPPAPTGPPPAPTTGPPSDHHRTTVGPSSDHHRTTVGPPSEHCRCTTCTHRHIGPLMHHRRTTAVPPPDHSFEMGKSACTHYNLQIGNQNVRITICRSEIIRYESQFPDRNAEITNKNHSYDHFCNQRDADAEADEEMLTLMSSGDASDLMTFNFRSVFCFRSGDVLLQIRRKRFTHFSKLFLIENTCSPERGGGAKMITKWRGEIGSGVSGFVPAVPVMAVGSDGDSDNGSGGGPTI